jgi:hypothetical protein
MSPDSAWVDREVDDWCPALLKLNPLVGCSAAFDRDTVVVGDGVGGDQALESVTLLISGVSVELDLEGSGIAGDRIGATTPWR